MKKLIERPFLALFFMLLGVILLFVAPGILILQISPDWTDKWSLILATIWILITLAAAILFVYYFLHFYWKICQIIEKMDEQEKVHAKMTAIEQSNREKESAKIRDQRMGVAITHLEKLLAKSDVENETTRNSIVELLNIIKGNIDHWLKGN